MFSFKALVTVLVDKDIGVNGLRQCLFFIQEWTIKKRKTFILIAILVWILSLFLKCVNILKQDTFLSLQI